MAVMDPCTEGQGYQWEGGGGGGAWLPVRGNGRATRAGLQVRGRAASKGEGCQ